MSSRTICIALVVLFARPAHAAIISFSNPNYSANLSYQPYPNFTQGHAFPAALSFVVNDVTGELAINRLDVMNQLKTVVGYSLPPQSLQMVKQTSGSWTASFDHDGALLRATFRPQTSQTSNWTFSVSGGSDGPTFDQPMFEIFPWIFRFRFSSVTATVPEPTAFSLGLCAALAAAAITRSPILTAFRLN